MVAQSPLRVLVVDDNAEAARTLAALFNCSGHEAVVAHNGEVALERALFFHPDAVFIELKMPSVDAFGTARRLRQLRQSANLPLLALSRSRNADPRARARARAAGFDEVVPRPVDSTSLQATIERVRLRVHAARALSETARRIAEQSRRRVDASRLGLPESPSVPNLHGPHGRIRVDVEKSGTAQLLTLDQRGAAEELRAWLKSRHCRVGPVFETGEGRFAFFAYAYLRRQIIDDLIGTNRKFTIGRTQ